MAHHSCDVPAGRGTSYGDLGGIEGEERDACVMQPEEGLPAVMDC